MPLRYSALGPPSARNLKYLRNVSASESVADSERSKSMLKSVTLTCKTRVTTMYDCVHPCTGTFVHKYVRTSTDVLGHCCGRVEATEFVGLGCGRGEATEFAGLGCGNQN